mmetsp:Transcript_32871/g.52299  ORF Transcript_32871/g.52299 Transcript_32871/m.52299 type:complete len:203 (+) Transcript_32871:149-757(+)
MQDNSHDDFATQRFLGLCNSDLLTAPIKLDIPCSHKDITQYPHVKLSTLDAQKTQSSLFFVQDDIFFGQSKFVVVQRERDFEVILKRAALDSVYLTLSLCTDGCHDIFYIIFWPNKKRCTGVNYRFAHTQMDRGANFNAIKLNLPIGIRSQWHIDKFARVMVWIHATYHEVTRCLVTQIESKYVFLKLSQFHHGSHRRWQTI